MPYVIPSEDIKHLLLLCSLSLSLSVLSLSFSVSLYSDYSTVACETKHLVSLFFTKKKMISNEQTVRILDTGKKSGFPAYH